MLLASQGPKMEIPDYVEAASRVACRTLDIVEWKVLHQESPVTKSMEE